MAQVSLISSTPISNANATPKVANNPGVADGMLRRVVGTIASLAADSAASIYRMVRVPSNAHIHSVILLSDDGGATGQMDCGIYQTADNGGAVVDADHFASAVDIGAGAIGPVDITHESGVYAIEDAEKPLWEALALSADPGIDYDIALTVTEVVADVGDKTLKVEYV